MDNQPFWQLLKAVGPSQRRIDRMTEALMWLRRSENGFVIFGDSDRAERYVQFAVDATGSDEMASVATVAVAVPLLVAAGFAAADDNIGSTVPVTADRSPWWAAGGGHFGEPDHEPLLMEVGSGLWPGSSSRGLADDETVVARLAGLGLRLGGGRHTCLNFCRDGITEPSDILASLADEIMVDIVRAGPAYRLAIKRGHFR